MSTLEITIKLDRKSAAWCLAGSDIRYWAKNVSASWPLGCDSLPSIQLTEEDTGKAFALTPDDLEFAIARLAEIAPYQFANIVTKAGDCWTGDAVIQVACFNELKYG